MNLEEYKQIIIKGVREIFRRRMKERDFCIGERQVEILFRELLDEPPEPDDNY